MESGIMINLKDDFYEKEMLKTISQGKIEDCREFIAAQQEYIRSLVKENERLREYILDQLINQ